MSEDLTPLERKCLELTAAEHWPGVRLDGIRATSREHTGVGRFTYLEDLNHQVLPDGLFETAERAIQMEGLRLGLDFAVAVTSSRLDNLELVTPGDDGWDGVERPWSVL